MVKKMKMKKHILKGDNTSDFLFNLCFNTLFFCSAYDPSKYESLQVPGEIKNLFSFITFYTPQMIEISSKLKPFIPDYIPAVGDVDAFIKVIFLSQVIFLLCKNAIRFHIQIKRWKTSLVWLYLTNQV